MSTHPYPLRVTHGVLAVIRRRGRFLLIQRAAGVRLPGVWCFPGGHVNKGESQADAVVREMREELRIRVRPTRRLMTLRKHGGRLVLDCWLADMDGARVRPNRAEVAAAAWLTPRQIRSMRLARQAVPLDGPPRLIAGTRRVLSRLGV